MHGWTARTAPWGTAASVALHAGLLALLLLPAARTLAPRPTPAIAVELISAAQFARLLATAAPQPTEPEPVPVPATPAPAPAPETMPAAPPETDGMVHATRLRAAGILAESSKLRQALGAVADSERLVQLCGVEGIEQIREHDAAFDPDMIVAYAMGETVRNGLTLRADGAAFRSARVWYGLRFRCTVTADFRAVTDYQFSIGDAIPREEWEAHDLTEDEGVLD